MGCGNSTSGSSGNDPSGKNKPKSAEKQQAKDENKEYQNKMEFLKNVNLMKRLPKDQLPLVSSAMTVHEFQKGETVIKQGDIGDEFFIIRQGEASVKMADAEVAKLKAGDYFGETALLRDEPRTASIVALSAMSTYKITRGKFRELGLNDKLKFANRKAVGVGGGNTREGKVKPPSPKTPQEEALIADALKKNQNIQTMVTLDKNRIKNLVDIAWKETVEAGNEVIKEGDLNADYFYIVQEGSFEISVADHEGSSDEVAYSAETLMNRGDSKILNTEVKGGSFGELALLYLVPRAATVKAKEKSVVWVIDRWNFKDILMKVTDTKITEYINYLKDVEDLQALLDVERREVAKALREMHFTKDEVVLKQGEPGNTFYILYDGEVSIIVDGEEKNKLDASVARGTAQYFGEKALLKSENRAATVKVVSSSAKTLALDREDFNMLLGPLQEIIARSGEKVTRPSAVKGKGERPLTADETPKDDRILRKDLHRIGLLGCGGFGTVELYEHKKTGDTYAMKGLSKGYIMKTGMQDSVMNEKNILMMTKSVFIIKLYETYNGSQSLYFLLELARGGELYATYNRKGLHGSETHAKYYSAGVVVAFDHLHERRIIYRDLKPENLLLTEHGHIKLTDMGLAKFVIGKTYTTCGTPDYFAPELISSSGHTTAVDWWTLGILIFELMSGHPPFESAYPMQIYAKVMKGISKVVMPTKCQGDVGDLIKSLLKSEPSERLPMRSGGIKNLKDHKWFSKFNWDDFQSLKMDTPYKPVVKSKKDLANFSARKEDMPRQIEYHDPGTGWDKDFATA